MAEIIQGVLSKFSLYLLTCFHGACSSRIEFMLPNNELMERFTSCWSNWRTSPIFIKTVKNNVLLKKFRPVSFISTWILARWVWKYIRNEQKLLQMIRYSGSYVTRNHFMRNSIGEYITNECLQVTISLAGCKIYGINEFEARDSKNSLAGWWSL